MSTTPFLQNILCVLYVLAVSGFWTLLGSSEEMCYLARHKDILLSEQRTELSVDGMITFINRHLTSSAQEIKILDLSENSWNSATLNLFTTQVQRLNLTFPKLKYLVLRANRIDQTATTALLFWLGLESLKRISLVGNPLSLKRIDLLYQELDRRRLSQEEIFACMRKVLFLEPGYVKTASTRVDIYKQLVDTGHLPPDWAQQHKAFYSSKLYKNYLLKAHSLRLTKTIRSIITPSRSEEDSSNDTSLLSLTEGLSSLSLNDSEGSDDKSADDGKIDEDGDDDDTK